MKDYSNQCDELLKNGTITKMEYDLLNCILNDKDKTIFEWYYNPDIYLFKEACNDLKKKYSESQLKGVLGSLVKKNYLIKEGETIDDETWISSSPKLYNVDNNEEFKEIFNDY